MDLQVLVATMNQIDHALLKKMNIRTDAIIANQCDRNEIENFTYKGCQVKYLSFSEKGVGLNRNNALMRANKDICLLADDDIILKHNYPELILESFKKNPAADVIIYNLEEEQPKRYIINKKMNVGRLNYMRFGAARIAFKRNSITRNGISFNLHFGGGTENNAGEDTLFLNSCLEKGLKIIALPITIGKIVEERPSTWFIGYDEKYFNDKGALFCAISRQWALLLSIQFVVRRYKLFKSEINMTEALKFMVEGIRRYK